MSARPTRWRWCSDLPRLYDEPFADVSQLPTLLLARLARRHVTVALSGEGGDELFGGYTRYQRLMREWPRVAAMPAPLRAGFGRLAEAVPVDALNAGLGRGFAFGGRPRRPGDRLSRRLQGWGAATPVDLYRQYVTRWHGVERLVPGRAGARNRVRPRRRGRDAEPGRDRHGDGRARLSARRPPGQDRPGQHGVRPGGAGAAARPAHRRLRLVAAARLQAARRRRQMAAAPGAGPLCTDGADRPAEARLRPAARRLAAGASCANGPRTCSTPGGSAPTG